MNLKMSECHLIIWDGTYMFQRSLQILIMFVFIYVQQPLLGPSCFLIMHLVESQFQLDQLLSCGCIQA